MNLTQKLAPEQRALRELALTIGDSLAHIACASALYPCCREGHGGQYVKASNRYSRRWHRRYGPARTRAAGVWAFTLPPPLPQKHYITLQSSDGSVIGEWTIRYPLSADADTILGANVTEQRLTRRFGAAGQDDSLRIRRPYCIARAREGWIIADRPDELVEAYVCGAWRRKGEPVVQVVVRDPATGRRHHLTVPPKFGVPLKKESAANRVHAALAWTFGRSPRTYAPTIAV